MSGIPSLSSITSNIKTAAQNAVSGAADSAGNKLTTAAQQAADKLKRQLDSKASGALEKRIGALANSKLADTFFTAGPKDELLTVDVLGVSDTGILNNLVNKLTGFDTSGLESFRAGSGNILSDLGSILSNAASGYSINTGTLVNRVVDAIGGNSYALRSLSNTAQQIVAQELGISPSVYRAVSAVINGNNTGFYANNISDARGVFDLVGQITGDRQLMQFFDVGAEANLISGLVHEAIALGIPDTIDLLVQKSKSSDAARYALRANIGYAVQTANINTMTTMLTHVDPALVLNDYPTAGSQILANYVMPKDLPSSSYGAEYTKLKNVLDQVHPGWDSVTRGNDAIVDLTFFSRASADVQRLLAAEPSYATAIKIAPSFRVQDLKAMARRMYPRIAL